MSVVDPALFETPLAVADVEDCTFEHVMEIPGTGLVDGTWDLRGLENSFLGNVPLRDARVLHLGPSSGYLTFAMEDLGAEVVCVEPDPDALWTSNGDRERLHNGFWLTHRQLASRALVYKGSPYALPEGLGRFHVAVCGSSLRLLRVPLGALAACALLVDAVVITETYHEDLATGPWAELDDGGGRRSWRFRPELFASFARAFGLTETATTFHRQRALGPDGGFRPIDMFTVVAWRPLEPAVDPIDAGYVRGLEQHNEELRREIAALEANQREVGNYVAHLLGEIEAKADYIDQLGAHVGNQRELEGYVAHLLREMAAKDDYIDHLGAVLRGERPLEA